MQRSLPRLGTAGRVGYPTAASIGYCSIGVIIDGRLEQMCALGPCASSIPLPEVANVIEGGSAVITYKL